MLYYSSYQLNILFTDFQKLFLLRSRSGMKNRGNTEVFIIEKQHLSDGAFYWNQVLLFLLAELPGRLILIKNQAQKLLLRIQIMIIQTKSRDISKVYLSLIKDLTAQ